MPATIVPILAAADYAEQISAAARSLEQGGLVVLPTDTMYGVAGRLTSEKALGRLRALRPGLAPKPLTIHLANAAGAKAFLGPVPASATKLMRKLWPGPIGLTFEVEPERRSTVAASFGLNEAELYDGGLITLRCPDQAVALDVLRATRDVPIVLTQAPDAEGASAHTAKRVSAAILAATDIVLDAGPSRYTKPSTLVRIHNDGRYEVTRAGVYDERTVDRMMKTTILFVCSGNTCRSPMAMALARKILAEKLETTQAGLEERGITVVSAGSFAAPGSRATPAAVEAVKGMGADLTTHRSQPLTTALINGADAIYTMGRSHRQAVLVMVPGSAEKVQTLDPKGDIEDPIGSDVTVYKALAGELETLIRKRLDERALP